ncbi:hypothetical protein GHT06_018929 [Daphnia sinensis]|uniref:Mitochondrial ATP synthase regulatory component factor B n=1 Tax=Daphnia sinensis TaxID=1820382 RepID=A0AAD5L6R7_9CRUS|nr:hypothetical protein GHT06_018929 [Daphnia sinensis]
MVNLLALRNLRQIQSKRAFWGWLNMITNKVDDSRIKEVGPDRAAAEWLLRCGAGVRWKDRDSILTDYNSLPPGGYRSLFIEEIDATGSCIMSVGFPHLRGLKHLKKLILHKCNYLDNDALPLLAAVKDSLEELQLSSCEVRNKEGCVQFLHSALPHCDIDFPYASVSEIKKD